MTASAITTTTTSTPATPADTPEPTTVLAAATTAYDDTKAALDAARSAAAAAERAKKSADNAYLTAVTAVTDNRKAELAERERLKDPDLPPTELDDIQAALMLILKARRPLRGKLFAAAEDKELATAALATASAALGAAQAAERLAEAAKREAEREDKARSALLTRLAEPALAALPAAASDALDNEPYLAAYARLTDDLTEVLLAHARTAHSRRREELAERREKAREARGAWLLAVAGRDGPSGVVERLAWELRVAAGDAAEFVDGAPARLAAARAALASIAAAAPLVNADQGADLEAKADAVTTLTSPPAEEPAPEGPPDQPPPVPGVSYAPAPVPDIDGVPAPSPAPSPSRAPGESPKGVPGEGPPAGGGGAAAAERLDDAYAELEIAVPVGVWPVVLGFFDVEADLRDLGAARPDALAETVRRADEALGTELASRSEPAATVTEAAASLARAEAALSAYTRAGATVPLFVEGAA